MAADSKTAASEGLLQAMLAVQAKAPKLKKSATNPHFKSRFAPLDEIVETVNPLLTEHGLIWTTLPSHNEHVGPTLRYKLSHAPSGEYEAGEMPLLLSKNDAQGQGSAITYARRYALCAVLNLVADDDDDGARASAGRVQQSSGTPASEKQIKFVRKLLKEKKLTAAEIRILLDDAGVKDSSNVVTAVDALTGAEASKVIDTLMNGPVKTGGSDIPSDAGDFTHPPESPHDSPFSELLPNGQPA